MILRVTGFKCKAKSAINAFETVIPLNFLNTGALNRLRFYFALNVETNNKP